MVGVWDVTLERESRAAPSIRELDEAAGAARLWLVKTSGDGSYEAEILVDPESTVDAYPDRIVVDDWRLLHVPSGKLCYSGAEDFRTKKKQITATDSYFSVRPGDYRIRAHRLDLDAPERKLAAEVGEEDYAYWKPKDDADMRIFGFFLLALLSSLVVGIWLDWRVGCGLAALGILFYYLIGAGRRRDERFQRIQSRVMDSLGDKTLDDLIDDFANERPFLLIELQLLDGATENIPRGPVDLWHGERWD